MRAVSLRVTRTSASSDEMAVLVGASRAKAYQMNEGTQQQIDTYTE